MQNKKIKVAVIGGGRSNERDVSLRTSQQIAKALPKNKYNVFLIEITKNKKWLFKGEFGKNIQKEKEYEIDILSDNNFLKKKIDVAFIALHGKFGEDGKIQALLDLIGLPYTGSGMLSSALGMSKIKTLEFVAKNKIRIPKHLAIYKDDVKADFYKNIKKNIKYPCVVKPSESGSSIGISIVKSKNQLSKATDSAFKQDNAIIIEQYIKGRELTCGVMGNTNQTELTSLPIVEIITKDTDFFDYQTKYFSNTVQEICPAKVSPKITKKVQELAKKVHSALWCDGLTRSDFILSDRDKKIYFLEINTIPGQTKASLCPKEAKAIGLKFSDFLEMQIKLAFEKIK
ncbi:MAG: D-alanine--D-alanine ligase [Xanthomonadaceae bacterium]|nr:D-alanine--D-alanine ligase [Rhodospirillaceae bacterium]NIA17777.1 D-alanine--D-alanine ligase [Xanthomonadaceae bacterium]